MNFLTSILHLVGSSASAYIAARTLRDPLTRPNVLASFQLAESGSVPFLRSLEARAVEEGDVWLAEKLAHHAADEERHGKIFAHALKQMGKQVIDPETLRQRSENSDNKNKRSPFFAAYFKGYTPEQLKPENIDWLIFMGSTYILELDASKDFARMAGVLPEGNLKKGMLSIANDETRHASYLYGALERRLGYGVNAEVEKWRERKVNALVAMVSNFMQRDAMPSLVQDGAPTETAEEAELVTVG
jgi:rubrerythrin